MLVVASQRALKRRAALLIAFLSASVYKALTGMTREALDKFCPTRALLMAHSHIAGIVVAPMKEEKVPPGAGDGSMDDALLKLPPSPIPNN